MRVPFTSASPFLAVADVAASAAAGGAACAGCGRNAAALAAASSANADKRFRREDKFVIELFLLFQRRRLGSFAFDPGDDRHRVAVAEVVILLQPVDDRAGFHARSGAVCVGETLVDRDDFQRVGRLSGLGLDIVDIGLKAHALAPVRKGIMARRRESRSQRPPHSITPRYTPNNMWLNNGLPIRTWVATAPPRYAVIRIAPRVAV